MSISTEIIKSTHLVVLRAKSGKSDRYHRFMLLKRHRRVNGWSATKKFNPGDLALFYFGEPLGSVVALGIVASDPNEKKGPFDWTKKIKAVFCNYKPVWFLKKQFKLADNLKRAVLNRWYKGKPYRNTRRIPQKVATSIMEEIITLNPTIRSELVRRGFL